jgi:anti-sigma regulatory factor (Ser/Thr protein kinase)/ActR/RegA family two-component response regulator
VTACSRASFVSSSDSHRIALVVDSGAEINELLDGVFASENWSIQRVPDNGAALTTATATPFDLIITDSKNLSPENFEIVHKIRTARPHARLIILADQFTPGDVLKAMREGAFSYFSGPFEHSALVDMVREAMDVPCWDDGIEVLSGTPAWVSLAARCDMQTADRLVTFLRGVREPTIPDADREAIASASREILLNAMEHGGHLDPSHYVEISFVRSSHAIALRIKDPGQGFSLEELRHAAINNPVGDVLSHFAVREEKGLRPGGFGILLAKNQVDDLIYNEKGNEVLLIKYISPPASQAV